MRQNGLQGSCAAAAFAALFAAAAAATACADVNYRERPVAPGWTMAGWGEAAPFDREAADRIAAGEVTVVGISWSFPSGAIDWLFNPTAARGPFNPEWTWQLNRMSFWKTLARA